MKTDTLIKALKLIAIVLISHHTTTISAQTPNAFNYQAVVRNNTGQILINENVNVGIALRQGTSDGTIVFDEVHSAQTNEFGLVNLQIGSVEPASFETVDWSSGPYFLQISLNGMVIGTSQLLSVPYALYAGKVDSKQWHQSGNDLFYTDGKVGIGTSDPLADFSVGEGSKFQVQGSTGSVFLNDPLGSLGFATTTGDNNPMIYQYSSGTLNNTRMILAHSPLFPTWGLQYNDTIDSYNFIGNGASALSVNLGNRRVGIRETEPQAFLQVTGNSTISLPHLNLKEIGADYARIALFNDTHTSQWHLAGLTSSTTADARFNIYHTSIGDIVTVSGAGGGRLGIKSTTPTHDLEIRHGSFGGTNSNDGLKIMNTGINQHFWALYTFNNDGRLGLFAGTAHVGQFNATGAYTTLSDINAKTNISAVEPILSKVMTLNSQRYSYKSDNTHREVLGFMAQDVEKVFPEFVYRTGEQDEGFSLDYAGMSVVAIKAIQEQQDLIQKQDQRISDLENLVSELQNAIKELMKN